EHGRLHVVAAGLGERAVAAERKPYALAHARLDVAEHTLHVPLIDQGTHLRRRLERVAEGDGGGDAADALDELVLARLVHDETRAGVAGLAAVVIDAPGDAARRRPEVGIG